MLRSPERKAVCTDKFLSRSLPGLKEVEVLKGVEGAAVTSPFWPEGVTRKQHLLASFFFSYCLIVEAMFMSHLCDVKNGINVTQHYMVWSS